MNLNKITRNHLCLALIFSRRQTNGHKNYFEMKKIQIQNRAFFLNIYKFSILSDGSHDIINTIYCDGTIYNGVLKWRISLSSLDFVNLMWFFFLLSTTPNLIKSQAHYKCWGEQEKLQVAPFLCLFFCPFIFFEKFPFFGPLFLGFCPFLKCGSYADAHVWLHPWSSCHLNTTDWPPGRRVTFLPQL